MTEEMREREERVETETTVIRALGLAGPPGGGGPAAVDVKDGKIVRVRPLHFDWKYSKEHIRPWEMSRGGEKIEAPMKSGLGPFSLAYKKRALSPNRIKYPLKRVDWDPKGERNPQNRGISKYERISWDEAAELVAGEIKRVRDTYGVAGILAQVDGHSENKYFHAPHGCSLLLLDKLGDCTQQIRNPDSWEGWYWGSMHVWGTGSCGLMTPCDNVLKDVTENSDMVLFWGADPETTPWGFGGQSMTNIWYFWSKVGIKQVYICPDLNYAAAIHADKWIPVLPSTDSAMQLAIIYTWLTEGTYDKEYVATHTVGMDKVADYVLGKEDGIPKTPEWASAKCGVAEWTIKAVAREFAEQTTTIAHVIGGGLIRGPYSHEPARLECVMLGMQGLGKPGVHQMPLATGSAAPRADISSFGAPPAGGDEADPNSPGGAEPPSPPEGGGAVPMLPLSQWQSIFKEMRNSRISRPHVATGVSFSKQGIPKTLIQDAILNPPVKYWGTGAILAPVEDQFTEYTYPIPADEGGTEIHMIWTDSPCRTTCWNDGNRTVEAMRSPKIECIVAQHPWLENDTLTADIILPSNTTFEVDDLVANVMHGVEPASVAYQPRAIEPIGESKSDYEVVLEIAKKMGLDEQITEGKSTEQWLKVIFEGLQLPLVGHLGGLQGDGLLRMAHGQGLGKGPGRIHQVLRRSREEPASYPLRQVGVLLREAGRGISRRRGASSVTQVDRKRSRATTRGQPARGQSSTPLLAISNHGRWRVHAQCDDIPWTREATTCKVKGWDGYMYEPVWMNTGTAEARGIKNGDIVKVYNERGIVLGGAYVVRTDHARSGLNGSRGPL